MHQFLSGFLGHVACLTAIVALATFSDREPNWAAAADSETLPGLVSRAVGQQVDESMGYPRPFSFRFVNPKNLPYLDWMTMVISDLHLRTRQGAENAFKQKYPTRPVLVQINSEGLGLWGTWICHPQQRLDDMGLTSSRSLEIFEELSKRVYPIIDFPGYWVYEAGADTTEKIPGNQQDVTVKVTDIRPFLPSSHPHSVNRLKRPSFMKDIVICPRGTESELDWLRAEFASIVSIDEPTRKISLRRWTTRKAAWREFPAGAYLAPNANQIALPPFPKAWTKYLGLRESEYVTPFLPNVTRFCPRDPRTGLNAAEWLARHWIDVKRKHYPTLDGFVFDVSAGTFHPSGRISRQSDCDVEGTPDYFYFKGLDFWALGMYDFFSYLRHGVAGEFDGLGQELALASDANTNEETRFFDLLNGAEYEFGTVNPFRPRTHMYSSNLDRYLLWSTRSRTPRLSYIHNKYPTDTYHGGTTDDLAFYMHDNYYRLDMATACMGTGYVGNAVSRPGGHSAVAYPERKQQIKEHGTALPLDWDEYHCGDANTRNWLGRPLAPPVRLTHHLDRSDFVWRANSASAVLTTDPGYEAEIAKPNGDGSVTAVIQEVQPWLNTSFKIRLGIPVRGLKKDQEYALRFRAQAPSPYGKVDPRYASIPRNLEVRLTADSVTGPAQESLVFAGDREIVLTLTAPADGDGRLEFGLAEEPGEITLSDINLREGCADVLYRRFENGLVMLNGSATTPYVFDLKTLVPREAYQRIRGNQDPEHNSGEMVGGSLTLAPRDGIFLRRVPTTK